MMTNTTNKDLISLIGNTPLIEIKKINPYYPKVRIFAKFEGGNPGGSIKDRTALYLIKDAEEKGLLSKGKTIIEPTSGNTGIAIAMIAIPKGYKVTLVMLETVSEEKIKILRSLGAEVILVPEKRGSNEVFEVTLRLAKKYPHKYHMLNQYDNPSNIKAHFETTGPEIYEQMEGEIDVFTTSIGTTGTLVGTSKFLKSKNANIKVIGIEPEKEHLLQGLKNLNESRTPQIFNMTNIDGMINISTSEAIDVLKSLLRKEGLLVGISSGANVAGALKIAKDLNSGRIVTVLPDKIDRYLNNDLL